MAHATQISQLLSDQQLLSGASLKPPKLQDYVTIGTDKELAVISWASAFKNFLRPFNREIFLEEADPIKLKEELGDNWKQHAVSLYNDLRTAIGDDHHYIANAKFGNIGYLGISTEKVEDAHIASLAADWKELEESVSSSISYTNVQSALTHRLDELASSNQSAVEKINALHRTFRKLVSLDKEACMAIEWVTCVAVIVTILKTPNPGVRIGDWTSTAKDLLSKRDQLTFVTLTTKVGARSVQLR